MSERSGGTVLSESEGNPGRLAKHLSSELEASISEAGMLSSLFNVENPLLIKYQPQFDNHGTCIGAEALLRWEHKMFGGIYPPLAIKIAGESGMTTKVKIMEEALALRIKVRRDGLTKARGYL